MRKGEYQADQVAELFGSATRQLFKVVADLGEARDLSTDRPEMLRELQNAWQKYGEGVGMTPTEIEVSGSYDPAGGGRL